MSSIKTKPRVRLKGIPKTPSAPTYASAAARLNVPVEWVKQAITYEAKCLTGGGRFVVEEIGKWIEANKDKLHATKDKLSMKDQLLAEQVRKLQLVNDIRARELVKRAWVRERFHRFGGDIHALRLKSESEDPELFAQTGGDVPMCRSVLRGIWDRIMTSVAACACHFDE